MSVNADNYQSQYVNNPSEKIRQGEVSGVRRTLKDSFTIPTGGFTNLPGADNDNRILSLFLPEGAMIIDAKIKVDHMNVGAAGTFTLGTIADADGLIAAADASADDALERCGNNSPLLYNRLSADTQIVIECSVAVAAGDAGKVLEWDVEYIIN